MTVSPSPVPVDTLGLPPGLAVFDQLATMVAVIEVDGRVLFVNAAFEEMLGLSRRGLFNDSIYDWFVEPALLQDVVSAVAQLTPDGQDFFLTFTVDEGERYRFGAIDLVSAIPELDVNLLRDKVKTKQGDIYNLTAVENTVLDLTFEAGRYGYAFVDIRPRFDRDAENRVIGVTYDLGEGPRVYVAKVNVTGNVRTLDSVIRREFQIGRAHV